MSAVAVMVVAGLVLTACGDSDESAGGSPNEFHYGVSCDQTTGFAQLTAPLVHGIQAYAAKLNEDGGVNGKKIVINATDTQSGGTDVNKYVTSIKNHISSDNVSGEFVCLSTGALAYGKQFNAQKVPVMVTQQLTVDPGVEPYFFGSTPLVTDQADLGLSYLKAATGKDNPRIIIAVMDTGAGTAILDSTQKAATAAGMDVVNTQKLPLTQTDFSSVATQMSAAKADGVLFYMTTILAPLLRALNDQDFEQPSVAIGAPPTDQEFEAGAGWLAGQRSYATPTDKDNEAVTEMVTEAAKYGATKDDLSGPYFTQGWLAGIMIEETVKICEGDCNGEQFKNALEKLEVDTGTLGGVLQMAPEDHGLQSQIRTFTWDKDKKQVVPLSEFLDVTGEYDGEVVGQ